MNRSSLNPSRLPRGTQVGEYRVESRLGQGSMGAVYLARHCRTGEACALKVLAGKLPGGRGRQVAGDSSGRALARFRREARLASSISSPEVVRVFGAGSDAALGLHWIAMEYVDGIPLSTWLERNSPSERARHLALEGVFSAVAAAHRRGVVHRDLKPENVLISEDEEGRPRVKVLDFGIAKSYRARTQVTSPGLGSPLWTAPEQASGAFEPSPASDVWALGLLTFYVLTDKYYWRHANRHSSFADLAQELMVDPLEPASVRGDELGIEVLLPPGFDEWFARCVDRRPLARFADAGVAMKGLALLPEMGFSRRFSLRPSVTVARILPALRWGYVAHRAAVWWGTVLAATLLVAAWAAIELFR